MEMQPKPRRLATNTRLQVILTCCIACVLSGRILCQTDAMDTFDDGIRIVAPGKPTKDDVSKIGPVFSKPFAVPALELSPSPGLRAVAVLLPWMSEVYLART